VRDAQAWQTVCCGTVDECFDGGWIYSFCLYCTGWLASWQSFLFGVLGLLFIGAFVKNLLKYPLRLLLMVGVTVAGATVITYTVITYQGQWNSLLLGALALIVLGHAVGYLLEEVEGDNLLIHLFSRRYEMFYRKRVVKSGCLSQDDIHFYCKDTGEGMLYTAIFQPGIALVVDGIVFAKVDIMTGSGSSSGEEMVSDLGKIFAFLEISCDQDRWRPEGDLCSAD
jgi:hypothetical protein